MKIDSVAKRLGATPRGNTPAAQASRTAHANARDGLLMAWDKLLDRVSVLADYTGHIEDLDVEMKHLQRAEHSLELNDDIAVLLNAGLDEMATDQMRRLDEGARGMVAAVRELLTTLDGDLNTLRALAAI